MKYEKPEIVFLGSALEAVQGAGKGSHTKDTGESTHTPPAYEADEYVNMRAGASRRPVPRHTFDSCCLEPA